MVCIVAFQYFTSKAWNLHVVTTNLFGKHKGGWREVWLQGGMIFCSLVCYNKSLIDACRYICLLPSDDNLE
jgi:hypothetical protein